jgi:hypothetical protein
MRIRTTEIIAAANADLRGAVLREIGAGQGADLILAIVDRVPSPTIGQLAAELGVKTSSLMSRMFRAGVPGIIALKHAVLLYRLRRVLDSPGLPLAEAAWSIEASSPQAVGRTIRTITGKPVGTWRETSTSIEYLAAWRLLLIEHREAIRELQFPERTAELEQDRAERRAQLELEVRRRERAAADARARLEAFGPAAAKSA